jgi:hypothetical protein
MKWVESLEDLYEFVGYVILYAPDRFPYRDFLSDDDQMNLDRAFSSLRDGIEFASARIRDPMQLKKLGTVLDNSYAAYQAGDVVRGSRSLQEFETMVFNSELNALEPPTTRAKT